MNQIISIARIFKEVNKAKIATIMIIFSILDAFNQYISSSVKGICFYWYFSSKLWLEDPSYILFLVFIILLMHNKYNSLGIINSTPKRIKHNILSI